MTASDYGRAAHYLEPLRRALARVHPPILFAGYTISGSRRGEYRFRIGPQCSVFVQAPVTPRGTPRRGWRYRQGQDLAAKWQPAGTLAAVVDCIRAIARQYWMRSAR